MDVKKSSGLFLGKEKVYFPTHISEKVWINSPFLRLTKLSLGIK